MNAVTISTYNRVAQMNSLMNRFIREASVVKSQMNSSLVTNMPSLSSAISTGIGKNIDTYA
ncbi:MAG: hypothetical protein KA885_12830 [Spirochaetes bacterium]|nr:hypothetical protein [Spirochaetota bacterium]